MPSYLRIKKDNLNFPATYSVSAMLNVPKPIWILEITSLSHFCYKGLFCISKIHFYIVNTKSLVWDLTCKLSNSLASLKWKHSFHATLSASNLQTSGCSSLTSSNALDKA